MPVSLKRDYPESADDVLVDWAQKGDTIRADFGALGSISLQFV